MSHLNMFKAFLCKLALSFIYCLVPFSSSEEKTSTEFSMLSSNDNKTQNDNIENCCDAQECQVLVALLLQIM